MVKRIYVQSDNLKPLIDWLKTKPSGKCSAFIGGVDDAGPAFMSSVGSDYSLARWLFDKTSAGEFEIHSISTGLDMPIGVVMEE